MKHAVQWCDVILLYMLGKNDNIKVTDFEVFMHVFYSAISEPIIDSKYLQRSDEVSLRGMPRSASPTSIHFSAGASHSTAPSKTNPTRLSKDIVMSKSSQPSSQTPPLASAYFPNQAKVT